MDKKVDKEREKLEKEKKEWIEKEKKLNEQITALKKGKKTSFFGKKDDIQSEAERAQLINEVQEQMAEEYRTKFETMKENTRMMLEQNNQLEAEIKNKERLIDELRKSLTTTGVNWDAVKSNLETKIEETKEEIIKNSIGEIERSNTDPLAGTIRPEAIKMIENLKIIIPKIIQQIGNNLLGSIESGSNSSNEHSKVSELMDRIVLMENERVGKVFIEKEKYQEMQQSIKSNIEKEKYYKESIEKLNKNLKEQEDAFKLQLESKIKSIKEQTEKDLEEKWKIENDDLKHKESTLRELLQKSTDELEKERAQLQNDSAAINEAKVELQVKVSDMTNEISELKAYIDELESGKKMSTSIENEMNDLKAQNCNLEMRFEELQCENDFLKGSQEENKLKIRELQNKLDEVMMKYEENEKKKKEVEELIKQEKNCSKQNGDEKERLIKTIEELNGNIKKIQEINDDDKKKFEEEILKKMDELEQSNSLIKEKENEIENLKLKMKQSEEILQQRIVEMKTHKSSSVGKLQIEIAKLQSDLEECKKEKMNILEANSKYAVLLSAARASEERNKKEKEEKQKKITQIESFSSPMKRKTNTSVGEEQVTLLGEKIGSLQMEKSHYLEHIEELELNIVRKDEELQLWKSQTIERYLKNVFGKALDKKGVKEVVVQLQNVVQEVVTQNIYLQQQLDELQKEIAKLKK